MRKNIYSLLILILPQNKCNFIYFVILQYPEKLFLNIYDYFIIMRKNTQLVIALYHKLPYLFTKHGSYPAMLAIVFILISSTYMFIKYSNIQILFHSCLFSKLELYIYVKMNKLKKSINFKNLLTQWIEPFNKKRHCFNSGQRLCGVLPGM